MKQLFILFFLCVQVCTAQDIIRLQSGDSVLATVYTVSSTSISYRPYPTKTGIMYRYKANEVKEIKYNSGKVFVIGSPLENNLPLTMELFPIDTISKKILYEEVVYTKGLSSLDLYRNAIKWFAIHDGTALQYRISERDSIRGSIIGMGAFLIPSSNSKRYIARFNIIISMKNGKYKYELKNFIVMYTTKSSTSYAVIPYFGKTTNNEAEQFEYSLETFYPSQLTNNRKIIRHFEGINQTALMAMSNEIKKIIASLQTEMGRNEKW